MSNTRWLIGSVAKTSSGLWHQILMVTEFKQVLLLDRLFYLHDIQLRRAGKSCITRLSGDQLTLEIDRMCLQGFVLAQMESFSDEFPPDVVAKVRLGMVKGCHGLCSINSVINIKFFVFCH